MLRRWLILLVHLHIMGLNKYFQFILSSTQQMTTSYSPIFPKPPAFSVTIWQMNLSHIFQRKHKVAPVRNSVASWPHFVLTYVQLFPFTSPSFQLKWRLFPSNKGLSSYGYPFFSHFSGTLLYLSPFSYAPVSYTHLTLPTTGSLCRSRWSPYH